MEVVLEHYWMPHAVLQLPSSANLHQNLPMHLRLAGLLVRLEVLKRDGPRCQQRFGAVQPLAEAVRHRIHCCPTG